MIKRRIFYLEEEEFDIVHGEDGATVVHVLLQVSFQILKHQRQALVRVHDVVKGDWEKKSDNPRCHRYPRETKGRPDWPLFDPRPIFTIRSPASLPDAAPSRCKINKLGTKEKKGECIRNLCIVYCMATQLTTLTDVG